MSSTVSVLSTADDVEHFKRLLLTSPQTQNIIFAGEACEQRDQLRVGSSQITMNLRNFASNY
ncbi:hypothetical protein OFM39_36125, partial [Escherichia coli]|nr:hypothetical protein [Escherichia coli]